MIIIMIIVIILLTIVMISIAPLRMEAVCVDFSDSEETEAAKRDNIYVYT